MTVKPDFDALRAERNRITQAWMDDIATEKAWGKMSMSDAEKNSCYCDCANGGPCEHDFQGWREFEDGNGGERVCSRCGMGAMWHTLHIGM
jgi:hypothetical protein